MITSSDQSLLYPLSSVVTAVSVFLRPFLSTLTFESLQSPHTQIAPELESLIKKWIPLSYGKPVQREGKAAVQLAMEGMSHNTTIIDDDDVEDGVIVPLANPSVGVSRIICSGGSDFAAQLTHEEENRYHIQSENGRLICPCCFEKYDTLEQMTVHIIQTILDPSTSASASASTPTCTLGPAYLDTWNFSSMTECIFHILRHLTPAKHFDDSKTLAQCPYCFKILPS